MPEQPAIVLIVDDQPANLEVLGKVLAGAGFGVRAVTSGARAIEAATAAPPDAILLDVSMPGMDGYETCRRLHDMEALASIPVLFITAHDDAEHKAAAFTAGGRDYVTKPFDPQEVVARVKVHVTLHRLERQLREQHAAVLAAHTQLQHAAELRSRVSAMVVHDIKSPLMVIGALLEEPDDPMVLGHAKISYDKILRLVHDLLAASKSDQTKAPARRRSPIDLRDIVEPAVAAGNAAARSKGVTVLEHVASVPSAVHCDGTEIDRVLSNLIDNAVKFTPAGGTVTVTLDLEQGEGPESGLQFAVLSVRDTGIGIPATELPYVFDLYRQREATAAKGSVGLGLAIVQRLVSEHGGRVRVRSQEGVGTEFRVLLPLSN